jgi:hypothetical protein
MFNTGILALIFEQGCDDVYINYKRNMSWWMDGRALIRHITGYRSPVPLGKFQMAPMPSSRMFSGSKKKEPR